MSPFFPSLTLLTGLVIFGLVVGSIINVLSVRFFPDSQSITKATSIVQTVSRRLLCVNFPTDWRNYFRIGTFGLTASLLLLLGAVGVFSAAQRKSELERQAAQKLANEAAKIRITKEADAKLALLLKDAEVALNTDRLEGAKLFLDQAEKITEASDLSKVRQLKSQIDESTDPARILAMLMNATDDEFLKLQEIGRLPKSMVTSYAGLNRSINQLAKPQVVKAAELREVRRLAEIAAEKERQEQAKIAAEKERQRLIAAAEEKRQADARQSEKTQAARDAARAIAAAEEAEAAKKAEEEYEENGLVMLKKTVKAVSGDFSGKITGQVVNRRNRTLRYAQISFNLYDESGAQVGSAAKKLPKNHQPTFHERLAHDLRHGVSGFV
jgi:hypothetical protein